MSLLDRLRRHSQDDPADSTWDGDVADDLVAQVAALAAAWDPAPDDPSLASSRAAALGAFAAVTGSKRVAEHQDATGRALPPAGAARGLRRGGRRPAFVLVATGALLAASLGTVVASAPGGLLYEIRVASEELLLPTTPDDRSRAQVDRLDRRLAEALGAEARGDAGAVAASLRAYARIAIQAAAGGATGAPTAAQLALRVRAQLEAVARIGVGDPALDEVRAEAQVAARALLGALGETGGGPGPGPAGTDAPTPGGPAGPAGPGPSASPSGPNASPSPGGTGGPAGSGGPGPSASPSGPNASPSPGGTGGPAGSGGPGPSASPSGPNASPSPGGTGGPAASPGPTMTPGPSRTPGGSGSPGGGGNATPQPSGGPSPAGGEPAPSSSPRGRP